MKPNAWRAIAATLAALAIAAALLIAWWLRGPQAIVANTYYNQVNYFYSSACGCWVDRRGHRASLPAIVNGDVHVAQRDPDRAAALHRAAPVLFAEPTPRHADALPVINNGSLHVQVWDFVTPPPGIVVDARCEHVTPRPKDCPAPPATITPPPVAVAEPGSAGMMLFGICIVGGLARRRGRRS